MDFRVLLTTFGSIFLAELGDKTQLATFCFAAESPSKWSVFFGSAAALILTSALGCLLGSVVSQVIPPKYMNFGAGAIFAILGLWMMLFSGGR